MLTITFPKPVGRPVEPKSSGLPPKRGEITRFFALKKIETITSSRSPKRVRKYKYLHAGKRLEFKLQITLKLKVIVFDADDDRTGWNEAKYKIKKIQNGL